MALTIVVLVFVAYASVCSGQSTPAFVPRSPCGIAAQKCYTDQQRLMRDNLDVGDFASGCQNYKSIISCIANLVNCTANFGLRVIRSQVDADQDGICGVDGSIQSCGLDVHGCYKENYAVMNDVLVKNFTNACAVIKTFLTCASTAISNRDCPKSIIDSIQAIQKKFADYKDTDGCDGPCPQAISTCTTNAETLPIDQSILSMDLTAFCKSSLQVYSCLNSLGTTASCASTSLTYLKDVAQNQLANIGDVCSSDGSPSPCVRNMKDCTADFDGVTKDVSIDEQCSAAAKFLECISRLPCTTTLAPLIVNYRNKIETNEIEQRCPSVGSCNERWANCGKQDHILMNVSASDRDTICKVTTTARKCFDFVKKDPICILEKNSFITEENDVNMIYDTSLCANGGNGGESRAIWFVLQLPIYVAALLASLQKYF